MFEFHKPDPLLHKLLAPQKLREGEDYVFSPFVLVCEAAGRRWIYSQLTRQGLELPAGLSLTERFSPARLRQDPALFRLMEGWFLKPLSRDETALYENTAAMMRAFRDSRGGLRSYTILPTLGCNARCVYCYEAGAAPVSMRPETVDALTDYIDRTRRPDSSLLLCWFGGEPLLGETVIERVLAALRARGVEYRSRFITNGSLIDAALADKMAGDWKAESVQITLDGAEPRYLRTKNYVDLPDAYRRVLRAVGLLAERGIALNIRLTLDFENAAELPTVLGDLQAAVPASARERVSVYLAPLYQLRTGPRCLEIWQLADSLYPLLRDSGFRALRMLGLNTAFRSFKCMAAKPSSNILITPEGRLSPCQHRLEGPLYGSVREGITDPEGYRAVTATGAAQGKCRDCPFLPDCSAYAHCPVYDLQCREVRTLIAGSMLRETVERALARAAAGEAPAETPEETEDAEDAAIPIE